MRHPKIGRAVIITNIIIKQLRKAEIYIFCISINQSHEIKYINSCALNELKDNTSCAGNNYVEHLSILSSRDKFLLDDDFTSDINVTSSLKIM